MNKTYILLIALIAIIAISAYILFPTVNTELNAYSISENKNNNAIVICLSYNETSDYKKGYRHIPLDNCPIEINISDENKTLKSYNYITDSRGEVKIKNLRDEKINVSAYYRGDNMFKSAEWSGTVNLKFNHSYQVDRFSKFSYDSNEHDLDFSSDSDSLSIHNHSYHI